MIKESAGKLRIRARLPRRRVWVIGVALVVIGLVPLGVAKLPDLWHAIWHPRQHWIIIGAILAAVGTAFLVASTVRLG